jgi:hypothetical protein
MWATSQRNRATVNFWVGDRKLHSCALRCLPLPIRPVEIAIERSWCSGTLALTPMPARCTAGSPCLYAEK